MCYVRQKLSQKLNHRIRLRFFSFMGVSVPSSVTLNMMVTCACAIVVTDGA